MGSSKGGAAAADGKQSSLPIDDVARWESKKKRKLSLHSAAWDALRDIEGYVDELYRRRRKSVCQILGEPLKKSKHKTLRLFMYHTAKNQTLELATDLTHDDPPSWTFRMEGRLMDTQDNMIDFTSYFSRIIVEIDPEVYPDEPLIEWSRSRAMTSCSIGPAREIDGDGFELRKVGDKSCKLRIFLHLQADADKLRPSKPLRQIISRYMTEDLVTMREIIQWVYKYAETHKCLDMEKVGTVRCDNRLKKLCECDTISFGDLVKKLLEHVGPAPPVYVEYDVSLSRLERGNEEDPLEVFTADLKVEIEEDREEAEDSFIGTLSTPLAQNLSSERALEQEIESLVKKVEDHERRRRFLVAFINNPRQFIHDFIDTHAESNQILAAEEGRDALLERTGEHFAGEWIDRAIERYNLLTTLP